MLNRRLLSVVGSVTAMISLIALAGGPTSAVAFSPASLTGLRFWVDSSDASTVTSSNGLVSQVTDKSGNGLTLSQSNSARMPTFGASTVNGRNVFTFDGDDSLASASITQQQPVTMFAVVRSNEDDGANRQVIGNTFNRSPVFYKAEGVWRLYAGEELISNTQVNTNWHFLGGVVDAGNSQLRLDGTVLELGDTGSQPWSNRPLWIGDSEEYGGGSFGWIGDIAEVLIYSRVLTNAEITQVESYLNTKWIPVPAPTTPPTSPPTVPPTSPPTTPPTIPATSPSSSTSSSTTVAPALDIVVNAPSSPGATATTVPIGQSQIPTVSQTANDSASKPLATSSISTTTIPLSTTTTLLPTNNVATPQPPVPPLATSGVAAMKVGDITTQANVERSDNQLVVTAGNLKAVVGGLNEDGTAMSLDEAGNVRLKTGSTVRIRLVGFQPESTAEAWLFSNPVLLGTEKVGSDGSVTATFTVPEDAPEGAHRLVLVARTNDNKPATLSIAIAVGDWKKESTLTVWLIVLPIVTAMIGALVLPATRRRRKRQANS